MIMHALLLFIDIIYILLTKREGRTGRISVLGLDSRPRADIPPERFLSTQSAFDFLWLMCLVCLIYEWMNNLFFLFYYE